MRKTIGCVIQFQSGPLRLWNFWPRWEVLRRQRFSAVKNTNISMWTSPIIIYKWYVFGIFHTSCVCRLRRCSIWILPQHTYCWNKMAVRQFMGHRWTVGRCAPGLCAYVREWCGSSTHWTCRFAPRKYISNLMRNVVFGSCCSWTAAHNVFRCMHGLSDVKWNEWTAK